MKCRFMCLSLFVTSFFDIYESIRIYTKYKKQREREYWGTKHWYIKMTMKQKRKKDKTTSQSVTYTYVSQKYRKRERKGEKKKVIRNKYEIHLPTWPSWRRGRRAINQFLKEPKPLSRNWFSKVLLFSKLFELASKLATQLTRYPINNNGSVVDRLIREVGRVAYRWIVNQVLGTKSIDFRLPGQK